jgi:DNA-binding transcriptional MerR regulator
VNRAAGGPAEYRIDELARLAGTTVRNVRVYQDRGLLPPPRRKGRVGVYSAAHLARLKLISQLLERGYGFNHIAELIAAWERGQDIGDLLGLEAALTGPWSDEIPAYLTAADLDALFGGAANAEATQRAIRLGLLIPDGDRYRVPSPRLLHAGAELAAAGVPIETVLDLSEALRRDLDRTARRLVQAVATHLLENRPADWLPSGTELPELAALIRRLRPLAEMAVDAHLAQAMERQVRNVLGDRLTQLLGASEAAGEG